MTKTLEHQQSTQHNVLAPNENLQYNDETASTLDVVTISPSSTEIATAAPSTAAAIAEVNWFDDEDELDTEMNKTVEHTKYGLLVDALINYRRAYRGLDIENGLQNSHYETHLAALKEELAQRAADAVAQTLSMDDIKALTKKVDEFDDSEIEQSHLLKPWIMKAKTEEVGHDITPHKIGLVGMAWDLIDDPSLGAAIQVMNARMYESGDEYQTESAAIVQAINMTNEFKAAQAAYSEQTGKKALNRPVFAEAYAQAYRHLDHDIHNTETTATDPRRSGHTELHEEVPAEQYAWSRVVETDSHTYSPREMLTNSIAAFKTPEAQQLDTATRRELADTILQNASDTLLTTYRHIDTDGNEVEPTDSKDIALAYLLADTVEIAAQTHKGTEIPSTLINGLKETITEAESHVESTTELLPNLTQALKQFEASGRTANFHDLRHAANITLVRDQALKEAVEVSSNSARSAVHLLNTIEQQK